MKRFFNEISRIGRSPMRLYQLGASIVITALCGIYYICEAEIYSGSRGVELYYAPMLDYIFATFLIFWVGMLLYDLLEREAEIKNRT
jgi:hypothetical protein